MFQVMYLDGDEEDFFLGELVVYVEPDKLLLHINDK